MFTLTKPNILRNTITLMFFALFLGIIFCSISEASEVKVKEVKAKKVKVSIPELIDLGASKCKACQKMAIILDELTDEYKGTLKVTFIDVWKNENVAKAEKYKVKSIPTQIFLSPDGKILWRHVGFINKESILAKWKELGFEFKQTKPKTASDSTSLPVK